MMFTVVCVWVRGNVPYTPDYVVRLKAMIQRTLSLPYRFVCLTDRPEALKGVDDVECQRIEPLHALGWWSKLYLFEPGRFGGRVLYLDLDTLVLDDLAGVVLEDVPLLTLADDGSAFQPRDHRRVIKRYNSSLMALEAGACADLWSAWTPAVADRLWGDQDWLAERYPDLPTLPPSWAPRLSTIGSSGVVGPDARIVLAKKPKPHAAAQAWPWVAHVWRAR